MKEWIKDKKECFLFWWYDCNDQRAFHFKFIIEHIGFSFIIKILTFDLSINLELPYLFNLPNPLRFGLESRYLYKEITENKFFELQLSFYSNLKTGIEFLKSFHRDHAGIELEFFILGFTLSFRLLDYRHWDYDNKWYC